MARRSTRGIRRKHIDTCKFRSCRPRAPSARPCPRREYCNVYDLLHTVTFSVQFTLYTEKVVVWPHASWLDCMTMSPKRMAWQAAFPSDAHESRAERGEVCTAVSWRRMHGVRYAQRAIQFTLPCGLQIIRNSPTAGPVPFAVEQRHAEACWFACIVDERQPHV